MIVKSLYSLYQTYKNLKEIDFTLLDPLNDLKSLKSMFRPRGGMVTQKIANLCIPVRFWAWPPKNMLFYIFKKSMLLLFLGSSVGRAVDC